MGVLDPFEKSGSSLRAKGFCQSGGLESAFLARPNKLDVSIFAEAQLDQPTPGG
jgi:hypothetical protein